MDTFSVNINICKYSTYPMKNKQQYAFHSSGIIFWFFRKLVDA